MLQLDSRRACTLLAGKSGSGKSTFALRYLLNAPGLACRFLFDPEGEFAQRLRLAPAAMPADLEADIPTRWVIYDPHTMFPGDTAAAFRFFCEWAFAVSSRGPGRKVLLVDEVWKYCSPQSIPAELALCIQTGRKRGLDCLFATQRPNRVNGSILGEVTELVAFRLQEPSALECVENLGLRGDSVAALPPGAFLAVNADTGGTLAGRVF
jgi:hypothetical protein